MGCIGPFGHARNDGTKKAPASEWLKKHAKPVHTWLTESIGGDYDDWILLRVHHDETFSIGLWSDEVEFSVSITQPMKTNGKRGIRKHGLPCEIGYIGAGLIQRAPRVGEQHRRGRDLYDGSFNENTWHGVMRDILRCSLLRTIHGDSDGRISSAKRKRRTTRAKSGGNK